ncbi:hypothetical protein L7F22_057104 [Adiantum nelumboides]|nr:hypothetical protein [Adiantum nelumboides]
MASQDSHFRPSGESTPYNILPPSNEPKNLAILKLPEVIAARNELKVPQRIRIHAPPKEDNDIFDALEVAFSFQTDNIKNQREHLILLLANTESELSDKTADDEKSLHDTTIKQVWKKTLENYESWCSYVRRKGFHDGKDNFEKLAFVALYLCIWGEAANVRFLPECICYIFHNLAQQLQNMLRNHAISGCFSKNVNDKEVFLDKVIVPIYKALHQEARKGKRLKTNSKWRNYDDFNEFFWLESCFDKLKPWPMEERTSSSFFDDGTNKGLRSKKVSFVEHRTSLHLYHSFVRLWILLILMLQGLAVLAFTQELSLKTVKILLSLGPTFFAMKLIESVLDIVMMTGLHVVSRTEAYARIILHFLLYGGSSCGTGYLYWKMLVEEPPSYFYLRLILYVLGSYATLKLIISIVQHTPSVRKQVEKMDRYRIIVYLKWLYKEQFYVGRGLYEHPRDSIRYAGFWIILLACKFSFSYYFQILPMANASRLIYFHEVTVNYVWHDFVSQRNHNALALFFLWAPVILIYLLDIQIWYTIFSAITGGIIGAKDRLGEIRSLDMIQTRFSSFSKAYAKNLQHTRQMDSSAKISTSTQDFAPFWNTIINCMREEDYITNKEKDLLVMPTRTEYAKWPLFLLASQVSLAVKLLKEDPEALLERMKPGSFMLSAVVEAYEGTVTLLKEIVAPGPGVKFLTTVDETVKSRILENSFFDSFEISTIDIIHRRVIDLLEQLDKGVSMEFNLDNEKLKGTIEKALLKIYKDVLQLFETDWRKDNELSNLETSFKVAQPPSKEKVTRQKEMIRRLHLLLTTTETDSSVPKNREAQRRLEFFTNSLFMRMPVAPSVRAMKSFRYQAA